MAPTCPASPTWYFPKHHAVLLAHGCFWHGHDCHLFKWPQSRAEFWRQKINDNRQRDRVAIASLEEKGWRVGEVWECALKGRGKLPAEVVLNRCEAWLRSVDPRLEVSGKERCLP